MSTRVRALVAMLAFSILAGPLAVMAQPAGNVYRVARLGGGTEPPLLEALRQGRRDLGWVVDQNVLIEARSAEGEQDRQANKLERAINLKTAKVLGLTSPPSLLARADEIIQ